VKFWRVVEPETKRFARLRVFANRLVNVPVVEKKLVVVAFVPVAFRNVKFWRVVEPFNSKFVRFPVVPKRFVEKRLVVVAAVPVAFVNNKLVSVPVVEKRFVEVEFVVVELTAVKFWRVVDDVTKRSLRVVDAVTKRLVVVANPPLRLFATKAAGTAPRIFLGLISPSQVGTPAEPPTSMPK